MIAAADEMDDLKLIAIGNHNLTQRRSRHHREIALDRDLAGIEADIDQQALDSSSSGNTSASWWNFIPTTPVHGTVRNYLYFDNHVGTKTAKGNQYY